MSGSKHQRREEYGKTDNRCVSEVKNIKKAKLAKRDRQTEFLHDTE